MYICIDIEIDIDIDTFCTHANPAALASGSQR